MKNKVLSFICIAKASFTWSPSFIVRKISFTGDVARVAKSLFIRNELFAIECNGDGKKRESHDLLRAAGIIRTH